MPNPFLVELLELAKLDRPVERPSITDWKSTETEIGVVFPNDFKELMSAFGSGTFGTDITFLNPCAVGREKLCKQTMLDYREMVLPSLTDQDFDIPFYPKPKGYVYVGSNSFGIDLLYKREGSKALGSLTVFDFHAPELHHQTMGIVEYLLHAYRGIGLGEITGRLRRGAWENNTPLFRVRRERFGKPID